MQGRLINGLAETAERIEPLVATLALVEEPSNCLLDQFTRRSDSGHERVPVRPVRYGDLGIVTPVLRAANHLSTREEDLKCSTLRPRL